MASNTRDALDLVRRRDDDERIGVDEVWFVDSPPRGRCVVVERRMAAGEPLVSVEAAAGDVLTNPLLEGFEVQVARLFERGGS